MNSKGKRREIQRERLPEAFACLIFVFNLQFIVHKSRSDKIVQTNKQAFPFGRDLNVLLAEKIK